MNESRKLTIFGIVRNEYVNNHLTVSSGKLIQIQYKLVFIPLKCLANSVDENLPILKSSFVEQLTVVFRQLIRNLFFFITFFYKWRMVKITIEIPKDTFLINLKFSSNNQDLKLVMSKQVSRHGIRIPVFDLSYDQALKKDFNLYDVILLNASTVIKGFHLPTSRFHDLNEMIFDQDFFEYAYNSLFGPFMLTKFRSQHLRKNDNRSYIKLSNINMPDNVQKKLTLMNVENVEVHHGQVIVDNNTLYLTDSNRKPESNLQKYWPNLGIKIDDSVFIPRGDNLQKTLNQAFYIGGTNNFMHFVIEELPRLHYIFNYSDPSIPILIKKNLHPNIVECIRRCVPNPLVEIPNYSRVFVKKLSYLYLTNYLNATMSGDSYAASELFDQSDLLWFRGQLGIIGSCSSFDEKIFIRRERDLFRTLANSNQISKKLSIFGFKEIFFGHESLNSIVKYITNCNYLVAEYGAALSNMVFSKNPKLILEICSSDQENSLEYKALSEALGFPYKKVIGKKLNYRFLMRDTSTYKVKIFKIIEALNF